MMKRVFLFFVIISSCVLIVIVGKVTFVNSNSVLIKNENTLQNRKLKNLNIFIDITENKLYLLSNKEVIKTYPISSGKYESPSPIGDWKIVGKDTWGKGFGGRWMGFNVPWGKYGIHGTKEPWSIGGAGSHGCIRMFNKDVVELYKIVPVGIRVKIYGGPYGPFGSGFRVIEPGDRGSDIYEVQRRLKEQGYFHGYISGIYGSDMRNAIHRFQKENKMYISDKIGYEFYTKLGIFLMD